MATRSASSAPSTSQNGSQTRIAGACLVSSSSTASSSSAGGVVDDHDGRDVVALLDVEHAAAAVIRAAVLVARAQWGAQHGIAVAAPVLRALGAAGSVEDREVVDRDGVGRRVAATVLGAPALGSGVVRADVGLVGGGSGNLVGCGGGFSSRTALPAP